MKTLLIVCLLLLAATAQAGEPGKLAEPDAQRVKILLLERQVIRERFRASKAEADFAHADRQGQIDALRRELATRDGIDLTVWELNESTLTWTKKPVTKEPTK